MTYFLNNTDTIVILSGEGTTGTFKKYTGKKTSTAIKSRIEKERCGGDRWAKIYLKESPVKKSNTYIELDIESGDLVDRRTILESEIIND